MIRVSSRLDDQKIGTRIPSSKRRNMAMLAFILGGIISPITVPGLTTTTSNPFSSANFHAAFSASVFEAGYQTYPGKCRTRAFSRKMVAS
jgi:hypothetical protein